MYKYIVNGRTIIKKVVTYIGWVGNVLFKLILISKFFYLLDFVFICMRMSF